MGYCEFCRGSTDTVSDAPPVPEGQDCELCGKTWAEIRADRDNSASLGEFLEGESQ